MIEVLHLKTTNVRKIPYLNATIGDVNAVCSGRFDGEKG